MGFVYIIRCEGTSFRKIGHADQEPEKRLATLQTGSPYELVLEHVLETILHREVERLLHASLARFHERGEWFHVDLDAILERICVLETFLVDEALMIEVRSDDQAESNEDQNTVTPKGYARCPHCRHVFTMNNIRRHEQTCREYK